MPLLIWQLANSFSMLRNMHDICCVGECIRISSDRLEANESGDNTESKIGKRENTSRNRNEQKSLFIAKVSHELRTPLHAVICSCNLLYDTNLTDEQKSYLKIVSKSSYLLLTLINNILDISKSEAGKIVLEYRSFCFVECLEHVKSTMDTKLIEKKHVPTIELKISPDVPTDIIGDETRITQVLMNLVANGIKFHSKTRHTKVQIDVSTNENKIHVDVADTGIGIPKERKGMLLQQFVQLSDDTTRLYGGTGRIWLKESQPDKGSVFSFEIPYVTTLERIVKPVEVELPRRHKKDLSCCKILVAEHCQSKVSNTYYGLYS
jgi:signal transduction histidine kinase